jgi:hypothetical protein
MPSILPASWLFITKNCLSTSSFPVGKVFIFQTPTVPASSRFSDATSEKRLTAHPSFPVSQGE